jgi:hypothetical protein
VAVKSLTSPHHTIRKVLKKEYSEALIKKNAAEGRIYFFH